MITPITFSASSAIAGSFVGAFASVLSSYVMQSGAARRDFLARNVAARQRLYSKFIRDASRAYAAALTTNAGDLDRVVHLYSLVSRMRLIATPAVIDAAENAICSVVIRYSEVNVNLAELQATAQQPIKDPLAGFSAACRTELRALMTTIGRRRPLDF